MTMRLSSARTDDQIWAALGRAISSTDQGKADLAELLAVHALVVTQQVVGRILLYLLKRILIIGR